MIFRISTRLDRPREHTTFIKWCLPYFTSESSKIVCFSSKSENSSATNSVKFKIKKVLNTDCWHLRFHSCLRGEKSVANEGRRTSFNPQIKRSTRKGHRKDKEIHKTNNGVCRLLQNWGSKDNIWCGPKDLWSEWVD